MGRGVWVIRCGSREWNAGVWELGEWAMLGRKFWNFWKKRKKGSRLLSFTLNCTLKRWKEKEEVLALSGGHSSVGVQMQARGVTGQRARRGRFTGWDERQAR